MIATHSGSHESGRGAASTKQTPYRQLLFMTVLSFTSMFVLMYAMVNAFANVFMNLNQVYMAGLMTAAMVLIEMAVMRAMYRNRRLNVIVIAVRMISLVGFWVLIRQQTAISDEQFLRSMIPHHAGAILMCQQAPIRDAEIRELCKAIMTGQQAEIDLMKRKLQETER